MLAQRLSSCGLKIHFFLLNNRLISSSAGRCAPAQVAEVMAAGFSWQTHPQVSVFPVFFPLPPPAP